MEYTRQMLSITAGQVASQYKLDLTKTLRYTLRLCINVSW
jgi:hypothetical protein